jgi:hypothetical protein
MGAKDVGNSTSSAPAMSKLGSHEPGFGKTSLLGRLLAVGVALGCAGQNLLGDQA